MPPVAIHEKGVLRFTHVRPSIPHLVSVQLIKFLLSKSFESYTQDKDHKRKVKFNFGLCHFFLSGFMPLFNLAESGGICVLRTHSSIYFFWGSRKMYMEKFLFEISQNIKMQLCHTRLGCYDLVQFIVN